MLFKIILYTLFYIVAITSSIISALLYLKKNLFSFYFFLSGGHNHAEVRTQPDARSEMGSTEILEKETAESLSNGTNSNVEAAKRLARRLYHLDRFKRSDVAKHLGKKYVLKTGMGLNFFCFSFFFFLNSCHVSKQLSSDSLQQ